MLKMAKIQQYLYNFQNIYKIMNIQCPHLVDPNSFTKSLQGKQIFKDQCTRCFHQPTDLEGIYICMKCFNSFCGEHRAQHYKDHQHTIYTQYESILVKSEQQPQQITKLAIGKQGGALGGDIYQPKYTLFCHSCNTSSIQNKKLIDAQIISLINTDSPFKKQNLVSWQLQINPCEHTLTLEQQPLNKDLSKCVQCDLSTNLWLCLTCGATGCGRKNWDGTGGNSHAIGHFQKTKHPLVVKLGTITTQGQASLYCYACNDDVKDQLLRSHLNVLGLNIAEQKKTQKTIAEMSIDLNLNFSLSLLIQGKNQEFKIMYGKNYTGMNNIGNSCYLNSVVQLINSFDQFKQVYVHKGLNHVKECKKIPSDCFYCQVAKIAIGLDSDKYSQKLIKTMKINNKQCQQEYQKGISPYDFKMLIAKENQQFLSSRQQDALEYLQILLDKLQKQQPNYSSSITSNLFKFKQANKLICTKCNGYKLIETSTTQWKFPIRQPSAKDLNKYYEELENQMDPEIKKSKLLQDPEYDVDFRQSVNCLKIGEGVQVFCSNCKSPSEFISKTYFKTTPKYLLAIANRFVLEKWVPKKLNALIKMDINDKFNIEDLLLCNSKQGDFLIEEAKKENKKYSDVNLDMLLNMGYNKNAAIRGLIAEKDNVQNAINWIMDNFDNNIQAPIVDEAPQQVKIDQNSLNQILDMGFEQMQARIALIKCKSNVPQAMEWLFNVGGDVTPFLDLLNQKSAPKQQMQIQGKINPNYELVGVIVHLGKSVHHGHYVVYLKKNKQWVLHNDEKVTIPSKLHLEKGYLYIFRAC